MKIVTKTNQKIQECIANQNKLCREKGYPHFAPANGVCYRCHRNIYQNYLLNNGQVSCGKSGLELVTGCPHCNLSFCE